MSELKVIKIELNNHGKPIASIQGTTSYYGISPNDKFYQQDEADKVIAEKDAAIKDLQIRLVEIGRMVQKRDSELDSIKGRFREFNDNVCKKIVDASRTMSAISQDAQMDFYEEFIKEAK